MGRKFGEFTLFKCLAEISLANEIDQPKVY